MNKPVFVPGDPVSLNLRDKTGRTVRSTTRRTRGPVIGVVAPYPAKTRGCIAVVVSASSEVANSGHVFQWSGVVELKKARR